MGGMGGMKAVRLYVRRYEPGLRQRKADGEGVHDYAAVVSRL
jgi:hypothetical protein